MGGVGRAIGKVFRPITKVVGSVLGFGGQGEILYKFHSQP